MFIEKKRYGFNKQFLSMLFVVSMSDWNYEICEGIIDLAFKQGVGWVQAWKQLVNPDVEAPDFDQSS